VQVYTAEAAKLGISLTECSHKVKDFSLTALSGDYRRLLVRPQRMSWSLLLYSHPDQDLGYTDLDAVLEKPKPELETLSPGTILCLDCVCCSRGGGGNPSVAPQLNLKIFAIGWVCMGTVDYPT